MFFPDDNTLDQPVFAKKCHSDDTWNHGNRLKRKGKITMDWLKIANAVKHEMFSGIGNSMEEVIRSMVSNKLLNIRQVGDNETNRVIEELQKVRRLNTKEVEIIRSIIQRAMMPAMGT